MDLLSVLERDDAGKIDLIPHAITLPADLETPVSAFLKLQPIGAKFLLESAEGVGLIGRYTFIGINPKFKVRVYREKSTILSTEGEIEIQHTSSDGPFTALRRVISTLYLKSNPLQLTLLGGLVGHIDYEMIGFFEPELGMLDDCADAPLASFYIVDSLLVFDHFTRQMRVVVLVPDSSGDSERAGKRSIDKIISALKADIILPSPGSNMGARVYRSNFTQGGFEQIVGQAKENIQNGNIFQIVLSQALKAKSDTNGFQIYRALRMLNPSPYMFYLDMEDLELIGSSPEMLVKLVGNNVMLRPIAGTRPRGDNALEDIRYEESLTADEKERAEHVMLVDLGRNDLGKICDFGSVKLDRYMEIERYSHVMHLTSSISGHPLQKMDQFDIFSSAFPAGTVTGAPKVKAMELIRGFEKRARGPYAGSVGYFSLSGDMDMCITIRTIMKKDNEITLQAGAGIVADSVPDHEYKETLDKLLALKKAIEIAEGGRL